MKRDSHFKILLVTFFLICSACNSKSGSSGDNPGGRDTDEPEEARLPIQDINFDPPEADIENAAGSPVKMNQISGEQLVDFVVSFFEGIFDYYQSPEFQSFQCKAGLIGKLFDGEIDVATCSEQLGECLELGWCQWTQQETGSNPCENFDLDSLFTNEQERMQTEAALRISFEDCETSYDTHVRCVDEYLQGSFSNENAVIQYLYEGLECSEDAFEELTRRSGQLGQIPESTTSEQCLIVEGNENCPFPY